MNTPTAPPQVRPRNVFVVLNPGSGGCDREEARRLIEGHFAALGLSCSVNEPGQSGELDDQVPQAVRDGSDLIVAAGGDGTVSAVIGALVGSETPVGIIPLGTANVLARELGVPLDIEAACQLLTGPHSVARIDAMEIKGHHYVTQVGVGVDALMIRDTPTEHKKRFGRAAYLWTAFVRMVGFQPIRFTLTIDGVEVRRKASEVVVANSGILGQPPFRWGEDVKPDDGRLDLCVVRAETLANYVMIAWHVARGEHKKNPSVRYWKVNREVTISTRKPTPVQADGEIVGETPVTVRVVPGAVRVVTPVAVGA